VIKAIVTGICGRMGGRISSLIREEKDIEISGGIERKEHPSIGKDIGEVLGSGCIGVKIEDDLNRIIDKADVVIDFTNAEASINHLKIVADKNKAIVIGSTGFNEEQKRIISEIGSKTRCLISPNMSIGVNIVFKIVKDVASILGDEYDIEILETHHRFKKDAPSGTAMRIAEIIAKELNRKISEVGIYGRKGIIGERNKKEIAVMALRAGDVVGEHTIIFGGMGERIEIAHRAHSRDNFARGAIRAAKWIVNQKNGVYDMLDLLGLK
jgi:4-hydroxy-tetrahydrodipicolinate reductase